MLEVAVGKLTGSAFQMFGLVAAGNPIEPVLQAEVVEVPPDMAGDGENFAFEGQGRFDER